MVDSTADWDLHSWRSKPVKQNPFVDVDKEVMSKAVGKLSALPNLVQPSEIEHLKEELKEVAAGKRFLLQGGNCAEQFADCTQNVLEVQLKIILQMSLVISWIGNLPTLRIGRMAGQYAKPRSSDYEVVEGKSVKSFRGDNVNSSDPSNREPLPSRLIDGYFHSAASLNCMRSLLSSGFADLHMSKHWELDYVLSDDRRKKYEWIVERLLSCLRFMETCGVPLSSQIKKVNIFTSHEALILDYESALTRFFNGKWYDASAHFVWIGDRTRQKDHAHVEFCRGIANPIGIKVGPSSVPGEIIDICKVLNPSNDIGKLVLILRFGADNVEAKLPPLITAVKESGVEVIFQCDPMHGNTREAVVAGRKIKTRSIDTILSELQTTATVLKENNRFLGGVHFEMTGEDVTECTGGPQELAEGDLPRNYGSLCDPRLNYAQSMEMSFLIAQMMSGAENSPNLSAYSSPGPTAFL